MPKPTLSENASWLINAGADDTQRHLAAMTGTPEDLADLHLAIEHETANGNRVSRLKPIQAKLAKFQRGAPAGEVEIVTAADDNSARLVDIAESIESSIDLVASHEDAFHESTLEHRLEIGLHIAQAQEIFTLSHDAAGKLGGEAKSSLSTGDRLAPPPVTAGFSGWLYKTIPRLKRGSAILYANAFRALELPPTAKTKDITAALKTLRHRADKEGVSRPSLKSLAKVAPKQGKPELPALPSPPDTKELRLGDARVALVTIQDSWVRFVKSGDLDELPKRDLDALKEWIASEMRDRVNARLK